MTSLKSNIQNYYVLSSCTKNPRHLVVILHGYGANGNNLMFMAHFWKRTLPDCLFIIPDAPDPMPDVYGFKWFDVGDLSPTYLDTGVEETAPNIKKFVSSLQKAYNIPGTHTALCGFSQGAMLSLATGLLFEGICTGILAYSGGLYLGKHAPKNTNITSCLIHGDRDLVVPKEASEAAYTALTEKSFPAELHILPDLEHQINLQGLQLGEKFLKGLFT